MDFGVVIGLVIAAGSLALAVWALHYARVSKRVGEESRDIARRGEQHAVEATDLARAANGVAVDAKQLAEEANTIALRAESRDTERHDVTWEIDWEDPGTFTLTNAGTDEAVRVRAVVVVDEWKATVEQDRVAAGGSMTFVVPEAADEFAREVAEIGEDRRREVEEQRRHQADSFLQLPYFYPRIDPRLRYLHHIGYRVDWETALGRHRTEAPQDSVATLGDHGRFA